MVSTREIASRFTPIICPTCNTQDLIYTKQDFDTRLDRLDVINLYTNTQNLSITTTHK